MPSSSPIPPTTVVYLVTGANRGIGYGLVEQLAKRSDVLIYATARDPAKADKLQQLAEQHKHVRVVKLRVESDDDHAAAVRQVEAEAGRVDVLLANAGIANAWNKTGQIDIDRMREHWEVNAVGPVRLFNHFLPLLVKSSQPKYGVTTSIGGSIASQQTESSTLHLTNYGSSKAAVNHFMQRVHIEHPNIVALSLHPGWAKSDMGNTLATYLGVEEAPVTVEQSVSSVLKLVDAATRVNHSGRFWDCVEEKELPW